MKTEFLIPSPDYVLEFGDASKCRVGDEVRVLTPNNPRWRSNAMHCIVREKNADGSLKVERLR